MSLRNLAIFVALGWFWLTFYSVGPLTSWAEVAAGAAALLVGCLVAAALGTARARRCRTLNPARTAEASVAPRR